MRIESTPNASDRKKRSLRPIPLDDSVWANAKARWSRHVLLADPVDDSITEGIAHIDLATRQICLNSAIIEEKGLADCVEGLLAHEIGHHVRYPGSLAVAARMRLLEQTLVPIENYSLINLFTDLMINERLGVTLKDQLIRLYKVLGGGLSFDLDPAFFFYLTVYEELWQLEPGELLGDARRQLEESYPGYRAEASILSQDLFNLGPNVYTQFIYFVSIVSRYIKPLTGESPLSQDPHKCGHGMPSPDDWAGALTPGAREIEAVKRALQKGWISPEQAERMTGKTALLRRIAGLPGNQSLNAEMVPEIMAAYYRRQAERFLLRPPPQRLVGESVVPTNLEPWEIGDPVGDIDWLSTLIRKGPDLGSVEPFKPIRVAEFEGYDVPMWRPKIEIYLDVSGSMPDPRTTRNAMTLAAQILTAGAIRAGGSVRALVYSADSVSYWQWCRSELEISRFLMHYIGGGTSFPFSILEQSLAECAGSQPIRAIISDRDFDANYNSDQCNRPILFDAGRLSQQFILLLHQPNPDACSEYERARARVVPIEDFEDFPRMAGDVTRALFTEQRYADF